MTDVKLDLSVLTEEEAALFEAIKLKLDLEEKPTRRQAQPKHGLKPYVLKVSSRCTTCNSTTDQKFSMVLSNDCMGLVSVKYNGDNFDEVSERKCKVCSHCRAFLLEKSKEELVHLYLYELTRI
jgi:hypothetical protein